MYKKRTISAWQREEDGSYKAEIEGFSLHVKWQPEPAKGGARGFTWSGEGPEGAKLESGGLVEEIEEAMGNAEDALRLHLHPETI